jgi:hypothetical protein
MQRERPPGGAQSLYDRYIIIYYHYTMFITPRQMNLHNCSALWTHPAFAALTTIYQIVNSYIDHPFHTALKQNYIHSP